MVKSKKNQKRIPMWVLFLTIVLAVIFLGLWISGSFTGYSVLNDKNDYYVEDNSYESCPTGHTLCGDSCYSCSDGYYLGVDCECYPDEDTLYEMASEEWGEHSEILSNDQKKANEIIRTYCYEDLPYENIPSCIDNLYPRLEVYARHIVNAQNFLYEKENVFSNTNKLLAGLDENEVWVKSTANSLDTLASQYNSWANNQQLQQEYLSAIVKILASGLI